MCVCVCVCVFVCVFKILKQIIVDQSEVEIIPLMEVKTQEHVLKLFSTCVAIVIFCVLFHQASL